MRILISFLLLMTSFVIAEEICRIESVPDKSSRQPESNFHAYKNCSNYYVNGTCRMNSSVEEDGDKYRYAINTCMKASNGPNDGEFTCVSGSEQVVYSSWAYYRMIDKEICEPVDPKPPQSCSLASCVANNDMSNPNSACYMVGKDVWYRPSLGNSRPYCSMGDTDPTDPDNPDPTDPDNPDPTDPDNPDPTDPNNPDPKPGEGGDNGSGNGNDNGGCIGNNCGNGNDNENGKGLTKSDVTQAIKDADILGCNGNNCKAGDFSALGGDAGFADIPKSFWESRYESHDLMKLYEEKIESTGDSIVAQLRNINTDLGEGTCPVVELPEEFGSFQFDCDFLLLIKSAFLFSATLTALFIVFRR